MHIGENEYDVDYTMVDIRTESKDGFDVATDTNNFIIWRHFNGTLHRRRKF